MDLSEGFHLGDSRQQCFWQAIIFYVAAQTKTVATHWEIQTSRRANLDMYIRPRGSRLVVVYTDVILVTDVAIQAIPLLYASVCTKSI